MWAGALLRVGDHGLPKRIMSGELKKAGQRESAGAEKEWTDFVIENRRVFHITGALADPGDWYHKVCQGGLQVYGRVGEGTGRGV